MLYFNEVHTTLHPRVGAYVALPLYHSRPLTINECILVEPNLYGLSCFRKKTFSQMNITTWATCENDGIRTTLACVDVATLYDNRAV